MLIINPANDTVLREIEEDGVEVVSEKTAQARAAQARWRALPVSDRIAAISEFREILSDRREKLAQTTTAETGKPIAQSRREIEGTLERVQYFLDHVEEELRDEVPYEDDRLEERIRHEPLGVIANVSVWNYPYFVGANVFIPALLTGNAVLYKPSELATLTGLAVALALHDAGVPEDVFVPVVGGASTGAALVSQPVDGIFFTGSYSTGVRIAQAVAHRLVRLQLELGGKDPVYVADDVDVAAAAAAAADGAFYNSGQSCCAVERVYVHEAIYDSFLERFVDEVRDFQVGDPTDETTYIGPLTRREAQLVLLEEQVADARAKGARLLLGGGRAGRAGSFFEPTIFADATPEMKVMTEESFGPIVGLQKVDGDREARDRMADTRYGLTAAVFSASRARAETVLGDLPVGSAYWNVCDRVSPRLPWSGRRDSGIGCTLSTYGIEAFLQPKAWHLRKA